MRMPFGHYRGWDLDQLPDSYVLWLLRDRPIMQQLWKELDEIVKTKGLTSPTPPVDPALHRVLIAGRDALIERLRRGRRKGAGAEIKKIEASYRCLLGESDGQDAEVEHSTLVRH